MYARIVKFEDSSSDMQDQMAKMIKDTGGPPDGVKGTAIRMLADRSSGATYVIVNFESEEDMRAGDEVLNAMSPPPEASPGRRASVDLCEVLIDEQAPAAA